MARTTLYVSNEKYGRVPSCKSALHEQKEKAAVEKPLENEERKPKKPGGGHKQARI